MILNARHHAPYVFCFGLSIFGLGWCGGLYAADAQDSGLARAGEQHGESVDAPSAGPHATEQATSAREQTPWHHALPADKLQLYHEPVASLLDRTLGTTSKALEFDWRRKTVALTWFAGPMVEWNSFRTTRLGLSIRTPLFATLMGELAASYTLVQSSSNSDVLAYTPFRQLGRPTRLEIDARLHYPLVEGIVTPHWMALPALTMVLSVTGAVRYLYYPGSTPAMSWLETARALAAPTLSTRELELLASQRLPGMRIHPRRYNALLGATLDVFGPLGLMLSPQLLVGLPLQDDAMGWQLEWHLAVGIMR